MPRVPSIPAKNSIGYEFDVRGLNRSCEAVGPGSYNLDSTFDQTKPLNESSVFISSSKRVIFEKSRIKAGPGSYFLEPLPKPTPLKRIKAKPPKRVRPESAYSSD
jgi:hypothetical protein